MAVLPLLAAGETGAAEIARADALTFYVARISEERTWQHVLRKPIGADYADAWLVSAAWSRAWREAFAGVLRVEWEANVAWNVGEQDHFDISFAPVTLRLQRFPWSHRVSTSAAFGLGLSYAFSRPEVEQRLEGDTRQLLIFWLMELTAGPPSGAWSLVLRLHHRSTGWGIMGVEDGGMNAPGVGIRYFVAWR